MAYSFTEKVLGLIQEAVEGRLTLDEFDDELNNYAEYQQEMEDEEKMTA